MATLTEIRRKIDPTTVTDTKYLLDLLQSISQANPAALEAALTKKHRRLTAEQLGHQVTHTQDMIDRLRAIYSY